MKVLDLFSGIGGFSLGLERAGFETVAFCEIDKHCHRVLKKHWPNVPIWQDVATLTFNKLQFEGVTDKIDIICGGFPCQDISVAGKKKGLKDESGNTTRSGLWFQYKRIIGEIQPRYVIIENVANLRSKGLVTVLQDLWSLGYDAEWHIISARSVGACHLRERIWIIAYPNSERYGRIQSRGSSGESGAEKIRIGGVGAKGSNPPPNTNNLRLWKPFAAEKEKSLWWAEATSSFRDWWETESEFCRIPNGIQGELHTPERVRKERIKQLGNSIVPQIAELIGKAIMEYENENPS